MLSSFLLVFDASTVSRDAVTAYLNARLEVKNWQYYFPGTIIVTSDRSTDELAMMIHTAFPMLLFFVTKIAPTEIQGWLPPAVWDFMNNPKANIQQLGMPQILPPFGAPPPLGAPPPHGAPPPWYPKKP